MTAMPHAHNPAGTAAAVKDQTRASQPQDAPLVFLVGPPGSGKSTLGRRACTELGLRFVDLVNDGRTHAALEELVGTKGADVVALPWAPTSDAPWFGLCRRTGETVALWAHHGMARFRSTWKAFATFLRDSGMIDINLEDYH